MDNESHASIFKPMAQTLILQCVSKALNVSKVMSYKSPAALLSVFSFSFPYQAAPVKVLTMIRSFGRNKDKTIQDNSNGKKIKL